MALREFTVEDISQRKPHNNRQTMDIPSVDATSIISHLTEMESLNELSAPREIIERLFQIFSRLDYSTFNSSKQFIKAAVEKLNRIIGENVHHNVIENFQVFKNLLENEAITPSDLLAITDAFLTFRSFALNTVNKIRTTNADTSKWVTPAESLKQRGILVEA